MRTSIVTIMSFIALLIQSKGADCVPPSPTLNSCSGFICISLSSNGTIISRKPLEKENDVEFDIVSHSRSNDNSVDSIWTITDIGKIYLSQKIVPINSCPGDINKINFDEFRRGSKSRFCITQGESETFAVLVDISIVENGDRKLVRKSLMALALMIQKNLMINNYNSGLNIGRIIIIPFLQ